MERIAIKIRKIETLLNQPLQSDTRRIWLGHLQSLHEMMKEKEAERVQALARLGGAWIK
jgi:hypothetical protein